MTDIKNPHYWNELWQENLGKHMDNDPVQGWNKKAINFSKINATKQGQKRIDGVLDFLKQNDAFWPGMKILDMGCGPGNFSIPFALLGAEVTAFDPAPKMLELLEQRIGEQKIKNIEIVQGLWEKFDVQGRGWEKNFDLVFASQSPGLRDIDTLLKMNYCSKNYCFASGFDGARAMSLYDAFCTKHFGQPYMKNSHDIIYLINLLYSLGHRPTVEFLNLNRIEEYTREELINNLEEILTAENLEIKAENIQDFLATLPKKADGKVQQHIRQVMGLVLWERKKY